MKILSSVLYEMYLHSYWKVARMCAKLKLPKNVNKNNKNSKIVVSALDLTAVWPEGGNFPVLWDFWPKRGDRFLRMGICGINSKRGGF